MESNDLTLGQDMGESMSDAEHTAPATQAAPESSDNTTPQTESSPIEATPLEVAGDESISVSELHVEGAEEEEAAPEAGELEHAVAAVELDSEEAEETEPEAVEGEEAPRFRRGELVDGTVAATSPTEVLVDLGEGITGVIASRELERMDRSALEALKVGSEVTAYVLKAKGSDGHPVLSLARAEEEKNWRLAETYYQNKQVYFSKVAGYNKGGLIVRFGKVRGFVPASQISRERQQRAAGESPEEKWGNMVGEDIAVKVVEIERARNRLILSERAAAREWREQKKAHLLEDLAVGEVRKGRVISIADFGVFVDLGGADGLVHLTELSWKHITHPREVLEVGQEVEVEVISIDRDRKRIGLSMKRRENDPWQEVVRDYKIGQLVQATVTKLTKFGAFARLVDAPEIEGLIHISELADYRVSHPREVVLVSDVLTLRIVKIDAEQRRLGLSLRQVDSAKYMDQDWQFVAGDMDGDMDGEPPSMEEPSTEPLHDESESDSPEG